MPQYKMYCKKCEGIQLHYLNSKTDKIECVRCKDINTGKARHDYQEDMGGGEWMRNDEDR